jgi:glutamate carboxypeptidase
MHDPGNIFDWIDAQRDRMIELVTRWAGINTGTQNLTGLKNLSDVVRNEFVAALVPTVDQIEATGYDTVGIDGEVSRGSLASMLRFCRMNPAPDAVRVLLSIHLDTVFAVNHPFQKVNRPDAATLVGPGVADAKGGLVVLLIALQALERSPAAGKIAWEVLLNCDEEIGSPGSAEALVAAAGRNQLGLVFEPAHADGALVGERKGSGNFTAVVRGRAAHAGRDFHHGRNAIHAAAELIAGLDEMNGGAFPGVTVNVGRVDGGGPSNIVPDLAIVRFNVRLSAHDQPDRVTADIRRAVERTARRDGISVELTGSFTSPPRPMDVPTTKLYQQLADCGKDFGMNVAWHASGGVSDANKLAAAGLPVIDSLGPSGGNLHSDQELVLVDTLTQKAKLAAAFLMRIADGSAST